MEIIALDDEKFMLMNLVNCINEAAPDANIHSFSKSSELLAYMAKNAVDVAFLDIKLRGSKTGIDVGKEIQEIHPQANIIFCTGYSEYGLAAVKLRCSGYVEKPVTAKAIREELSHLRYPITGKASINRIRCQCFGNFEIYLDEKPIQFENKKTKELIAYLVDRRGTMCTNQEIQANLWEDDKQHISYFKKIRKELKDLAFRNDLEELLVIHHGSIGINRDMIDCDYYDYLQGINRDLYKGEYMIQYPWADYTMGYDE